MIRMRLRSRNLLGRIKKTKPVWIDQSEGSCNKVGVSQWCKLSEGLPDKMLLEGFYQRLDLLPSNRISLAFLLRIKR